MDDSPAAIEGHARDTLAGLPDPFARLARDLAVVVAEHIPDHLMEVPGSDDERWEVTGLYDGIPVTEKSAFDQPLSPDTIWLFRAPILEELSERPGVTLAELVAHVTIHEAAHHFGWSDDDIAAIDRWWE
ncbi:MAG: metallopeptidase family protein [Paracoccaceae bacterium]